MSIHRMPLNQSEKQVTHSPAEIYDLSFHLTNAALPSILSPITEPYIHRNSRKCILSELF